MTNQIISRVVKDLSKQYSKDQIVLILTSEFGCDKDEVNDVFTDHTKEHKKFGKKPKEKTHEEDVRTELHGEIDNVIAYMKEKKDVTVEQLMGDCLLHEDEAYEIIKILENNGLLEQKIPLFGKNKVVIRGSKK